MLLPAIVANAQQIDAPTLVEQGNEAYAQGKYREALNAYREAEVALPESPELAYNIGAAQFKLNDYNAARDAFNRALLTRDLSLEAKAKYNLGDVAYISALDKQSNPAEALELAKAAIGHYRDALELDPEDNDARTNIEIAQLFIKDMLDKQKQQQEQQQQQQGDQNQQDQQQQQQQGQQDDQNQDEQQQQEPSEQDQQQQQQQGDQQNQQQQPQSQSGDEQEQQADQNQQQQQPQPVEMTPEEAERLLQAIRDKERQRREDLERRRRAAQVPVLKDW